MFVAAAHAELAAREATRRRHGVVTRGYGVAAGILNGEQLPFHVHHLRRILSSKRRPLFLPLSQPHVLDIEVAEPGVLWI